MNTQQPDIITKQLIDPVFNLNYKRFVNFCNTLVNGTDYSSSDVVADTYLLMASKDSTIVQDLINRNLLLSNIYYTFRNLTSRYRDRMSKIVPIGDREYLLANLDDEPLDSDRHIRESKEQLISDEVEAARLRAVKGSDRALSIIALANYCADKKSLKAAGLRASQAKKLKTQAIYQLRFKIKRNDGRST